MITDTDIKNLEGHFRQIFVTKDEFNTAIDNIIEVINSVGKTIITEIKEEFRDILENHERRIERLESLS